MDEERDELEDSAVPADQPAGFNIPYHPTDDLGHLYVPYSGEHLSPYGDAAASHHSPVPQSTMAWNDAHLSHSAHSFASSSFDTTPVPFHDPSTSFHGPSTSFHDPSLQMPSLVDSLMDFSQPMAPGMVESVLSQLPHHEASFLFSDIPIDPALHQDTFPLDPALADNFDAALPPVAPTQPEASSSFTMRSSYAAFVEDEADPEAPHVVISETTFAMEVESVPQPPAEAEIEEIDDSPEVEEPSVEEEPEVEEPQSELSHHIPEIGEPEIEEAEDDDGIGEPEIEELDDSSRSDSSSEAEAPAIDNEPQTGPAEPLSVTVEAKSAPATPFDSTRQEADDTPAISPSPAPSDSIRHTEDEAPAIVSSPGHVATPIGGDEASPIDVSDDDSADDEEDDAEPSPVSADTPSDSSPEQTPDLQVFDGDDNVATPRPGDKTAAVVPSSSAPETAEGAPDIEMPRSVLVPQAPPATLDDEPSILADHPLDSDEPIVVESDSEEDEEPAPGESSEESEPIENREPSEETEPIESQGSVVADDEDDDDEPMIVDDDASSTPPTPSEVDELATRPVTPAEVQDCAAAPSESSTEPEEAVELQPDSVPSLLDAVDEPEEPVESAGQPAELDESQSPVQSVEESDEPEEPLEVEEPLPPTVLQLVESDEEPEEPEEPSVEASEDQEAQQSPSPAVPLLLDSGEAPEELEEPHSVLASPQATIADDHSVVEPPAVVVVEGSPSPDVVHSDADLVLDADSLAPPVEDGSAAGESTSATEDEGMDVDEQEVDELDDSRFPTPGPVPVPESAPEPVAEDTTPAPAVSPEPVPPAPAPAAEAPAPVPPAESSPPVTADATSAPMAWKHFHGKARPPPKPEAPREALRSEPEVVPAAQDDQPLDKESSRPADTQQPHTSESSAAPTPPADTKPEPLVEPTDNTNDHSVEDLDKEPQTAEPTTKRAPRKSRLSVPGDISPPTTRSRCHPRKVQIDDGDLSAIVLVPQCCVPGPDKLRAEDAKDLGVGTFDEAFEEGRALAFHLTPIIFQKASRLFGISVFNEEDIFVLSASEGVIEERPTRERRLSTNRTPDPDWRDGTPLRAGSSQPSGRRHRRGSSIGSFTLARTPDPEGTPIHSNVGFLSSQGSTRHRKRASTASVDVPPLDPATHTPSPSKRLVTFKEPDTASIRRSARKSAGSLEPPSPAPAAPKSPKASGSPVIATRRVTRSMEAAQEGEPMAEDEAEPAVDEEPAEAAAPPALGTRTRKRKLESEQVVKEEEDDEETEGETPVRARSGKRRAVPSSSLTGKPKAQDVNSDAASEGETKANKGSWSLRGFFGWKK